MVSVNLIGGMVFLLLGIISSIFFKKISKMWWLGMPSVVEATKGVTDESREIRFNRREILTRLMGFVLILIGLFFIIKELFF